MLQFIIKYRLFIVLEKRYAFTHISLLLQFSCAPHLRKAEFSGIYGGCVAVSQNA